MSILINTLKMQLFKLLVLLLSISQLFSQRLDFAAVGDVMLGRGVNSKAVSLGLESIYDEKVKNLLKTKDMVFGNAEFCMFVEDEKPSREKYILAASAVSIKILKCLNFNIVSIANNHSLDYREKGFKALLKELDSLGIIYVGRIGKFNFNPKIVEKNGIRLGFLAYDFTTMRISTYTIMNDIAKTKENSDFVIVSCHWGDEYQHLPNEKQIFLGHSFIDFGASLVIGHHPHVIQPVEFYKDGIILYSLGNFIFDSKREETKRGLIFECTFEKDTIKEVAFVPVKIQKSSVNLVEDEKIFLEIYEKLKAISSKFNTKFDIQDKKILVYKE